jgi:HPt (histidine-containing phosphotransfer) domain-containing protein
MYYGYNKKEKILMADREFIELLGYKSVNEIINSGIGDSIKFEDGVIYITLKKKTIKASFIETVFYTTNDEIKILKLSNVIELKNGTSEIQLNYNPIYLDVNEISAEMGLSVEDYKLYLNSFINQSIVDYDKLLAGEDAAIKNLSTLALTLKVPNLNLLLLKIKKLPKDERPHYVDEYYTKLTLLTIRESSEDKPVSKPKPKDEFFEKDILTPDTKDLGKEDKLDSKFTDVISNLDFKDEIEIKPVSKPEPKKVQPKPNKDLLDLDLDLDDFSLDEDDLFPIKENAPAKPVVAEKPKATTDNKDEIILENVPKLPIDYNPKIAADELNLPVVLIEEFVEDFIEQAHHDKDHLLTSYYHKDMDNIHELGHKLKGAASNLRINELADVLEEIQFCTDYSKLKGLFTKYWGLLKSLEDYMKNPKKQL